MDIPPKYKSRILAAPAGHIKAMAAGQPAVKCRLFSKNMDDVDSLKVGKDGKQHYCAVVYGLDSYLESVVSVDSEARSEGRGTDSPEEAFES